MTDEQAEGQRKIYDVEKAFEWHKWMNEMPFLQFPAHWFVKATPPFNTGVIRYRVRTNGMNPDESVSIYLDCYDRAGCVGEPYWEVYPIGGDCERCMMNDTAELLSIIGRAVVECELAYTTQDDNSKGEK